jgi:hypothetical protein
MVKSLFFAAFFLGVLALAMGFLLKKLNEISRQLRQAPRKETLVYPPELNYGEIKHLCDYCGEKLTTPHVSILGEKGYSIIPHFKLTITSSMSKNTQVFCNADCLTAWVKEQFVPEMEYRNRRGEELKKQFTPKSECVKHENVDE